MLPACLYRSLRPLILSTVLFLGPVSTLSAQKSFEISKQWDILHMLYRELDQLYVDSVSPEKVLGNAINGMMASFDPYTNYIPESQTSELKFMTTGEYGGVGAVISQRGEEVILLELYENMPAQRAGLKPGDVLLEIDNVTIEPGSNQQASDLLKGEPGTEVTIVVKREGVNKPIKRKFLRERILINQVAYHGMVDAEVGYINLNGFTDKATQEVQRALLDLKNKGAKKLVLDLRGNGGGLLDEAVLICNLFVPKGREIVSTKGKLRQWDQTYKTTKEPIDTVMPLVILANSGSASSSEIVCGALQDLDRAIIVGTRTFGKGLVQTTRSIPYNGMVKLTTAKYYIPSGRCIQAINYSERNADGSVGRIPDSLMHTFYTKAGRPVRDGGGILPDFECKDREGTSFIYALIDGMYFFDFANRYARTHESISPASSFALSDKDFSDFLQYIKERGFTYERDSQKGLTRLKRLLEEDQLAEHVKEELKALESKLANADIDSDMATNKSDVELMLSTEIVSRYYFQSGELQQSLKTDRCLKEAMRVLNDEVLYKKTLKIN
jgi:carboxyl-terminal processing protease